MSGAPGVEKMLPGANCASVSSISWDITDITHKYRTDSVPPARISSCWQQLLELGLKKKKHSITNTITALLLHLVNQAGLQGQLHNKSVKRSPDVLATGCEHHWPYRLSKCTRKQQT